MIKVMLKYKSNPSIKLHKLLINTINKVSKNRLSILKLGISKENRENEFG
jgi:hypothetical protein